MKQILIVEDDSFLNKMLSYNLTADGYGVTSALNYRTAAEAIRQREFDLILLDVNLPDGSGFDLCKLVKPNCPDAIVIFLTANDQESDQIRGYEVGAVDYITKPFVVGTLQRKIKAMFDAVVVGTYNPTDLMERSPVVPGSPYFMMTYDMAKNLTGITEQTGILALTVTPDHFDEVLNAVQEIAEQNGKISVNTIEQTIKNIQYRYSASIKALYMAAAILFTFGGISLMNMLMVDFQNRKREFGLLEAVGATQKQLKAMLSREIGIYLGGSLTVSLALGTLISIIACQRLEAVNHCIILKLPWLFLTALIAAMVVIYMIFTAYAKAELKKTGILSAIREE